MKTTKKFVAAIAAAALLLTGCNALANRDYGNPVQPSADGLEQKDIYMLYRQAGGTLTYEQWLATIKGDKGDKGDQGEQGPQGEPGQNGQNGENGQNGQNGVGIVSIEKTGNDGYKDIYTITLSDGSSYNFTVPNPVTGFDIVDSRTNAYYVGTNPSLDFDVTAKYLDGSSKALADNDYQVSGFSTAAAGQVELTFSYGPAQQAYNITVMDIADEVAADLALTDNTIVDKVPGLSSGVLDYQYVPSYRSLLIGLEENVTFADALAQYQGELVQAGWTDIGPDSYGDEQFTSPNSELKVCAWNYYGIIRVDISIIKPAPTPANITAHEVLYEVFKGFFGTQYSIDQIGEEVQSGVWYDYISFGSGSSQYFQAVLDTVAGKLPQWLIADGNPTQISYSGDAALEQDYVSSDGKFVVEVIANLYNSTLYADFYVYEA